MGGIDQLLWKRQLLPLPLGMSPSEFSRLVRTPIIQDCRKSQAQGIPRALGVASMAGRLESLRNQ